MAEFDIAPSFNSDKRVEPGALSQKVLWKGRAAQLELLCACGRRAIELKVLGCCRLCYQRRYHSLRWFGGLRQLILKRDRFRCRVCGVGRRLVVHHRAEHNAKSLLITLCIRCHVRLHRSRRLRCWVPEVLLVLWRELHPRAPLQLQLPFAVPNDISTRPYRLREGPAPSLDLLGEEFATRTNACSIARGSWPASRLAGAGDGWRRIRIRSFKNRRSSTGALD